MPLGKKLVEIFGFDPLTSQTLYMSKLVKDVWRRSKVVSTLFLDIKSSFPSIVLNQLVHT